MSDESDRVTVNTYVPANQRDRWRGDADALDMSLSEFVRSMVQAGRRGFSLDGGTGDPVEPDLPGSTPRSGGPKTAILGILRREGGLGWSELVDELTGDIEDELESAIVELRDEGRIRHSPREGTYSIAEAADGE